MSTYGNLRKINEIINSLNHPASPLNNWFAAHPPFTIWLAAHPPPPPYPNHPYPHRGPPHRVGDGGAQKAVPYNMVICICSMFDTF